MRETINKYAVGKTVLLFLILANLLYLLMLLVTIPKVMAFANGMKLFDLMPTGYDPDYARTFLNTLGTEGRAVYLNCQIPVDLFYPLFSGIAYCLLMAWLFKKLHLSDKPVFYLCLIPLVAGLFDYLENFGIIIMINSYPRIQDIMVNTVNIFSIMKSMLSALFFTILIVAFVVFLIKQITRIIK